MKWLSIVAMFSMPIGCYILGEHDGDAKGYSRASAESAMLKSDHDRLMQFVGVCKWAKIMADDIRCQQELP